MFESKDATRFSPVIMRGMDQHRPHIILRPKSHLHASREIHLLRRLRFQFAEVNCGSIKVCVTPPRQCVAAIATPECAFLLYNCGNEGRYFCSQVKSEMKVLAWDKLWSPPVVSAIARGGAPDRWIHGLPKNLRASFAGVEAPRQLFL
jgi:hypothetical protein